MCMYLAACSLELHWTRRYSTHLYGWPPQEYTVALLPGRTQLPMYTSHHLKRPT